jgi:hypothetical protein
MKTVQDAAQDLVQPDALCGDFARLTAALLIMFELPLTPCIELWLLLRPRSQSGPAAVRLH